MKPPGKKRLNAIVALVLGDDGLHLALATHAKGAVQITKSASAALTLDPWKAEPELVGGEIKNQLDAAGIGERSCVVALPDGWIMSQHTRLPELSAEDAASFLQLEAEKGFPCDPDELQLARSTQRSPESTHVTQYAVRAEHLDRVFAMLKAAELKPVSFTSGLAALPEAATNSDGRIVVATGRDHATLLVAAGGGFVALRTCESSLRSEAEELLVNEAAFARELRITLGQIPADLRPLIRQIFLKGEETVVATLLEKLAGWAEASQLRLARAGSPGKSLGREMAEQLALRALNGSPVELEFLPPRPSRWTQLLARYNGRRLVTIGYVVGALAAIVILLFGWQQYRLGSLRSQWAAMQAQVTALDTVQGNIRDYRPWYDPSFRQLSILRLVTECFPDNGSVTAKSFEIDEKNLVRVTGTSRDNAALLKTLDLLRKEKSVSALKIEQIHGKAPQQFTFSFICGGNP